MMQTHFYRWMVLGLLGCVFCACSEKVETEEKKAVVEEEVKEVDPAEAMLREKLHNMILPRLDFEDVSVEEAIDFLAFRSKELDQDENDGMKGIRFVVPSETNMSLNRIPELRLRNASYAAALRYICMMTDMRCEVDGGVTLVPKDPNAAWNDFGSLLEEKGDTQYIASKFRHLTVPRVNFENASIYEAFDFLRLRSAEMDVTTIDPGRKGINFVIHIPKEMRTPIVDKLQMRDVSFEDAVKEICAKTGMRYEVEEYAVILVPKDLK